MRRDNIVLDEDVLLSLQDLPDTYNYGMYAKFINDYGTHFMTSGTMGGVFEHILVVNKEEMRRKGQKIKYVSNNMSKYILCSQLSALNQVFPTWWHYQPCGLGLAWVSQNVLPALISEVSGWGFSSLGRNLSIIFSVFSVSLANLLLFLVIFVHHECWKAAKPSRAQQISPVTF